MAEIPTTTGTFKALKSLPLPWIVAAMVGGGGLAGGSFLGGGSDPQLSADLAEIKMSLQKLDPILDKLEDLEDRMGDIERAIAVSEARHGRND